MNTEQFLKQFKKDFDKMYDVVKAKNADYSGSDENAFFNFTQVERIGICTTEQGILTRMTDKFCRVTNLLINNKEASVKDESVEDTLTDLCVYAEILKLYVQHKRAVNTLIVDDSELFNVIGDGDEQPNTVAYTGEPLSCTPMCEADQYKVDTSGVKQGEGPTNV
jgi:hypothetical protein